MAQLYREIAPDVFQLWQGEAIGEMQYHRQTLEENMVAWPASALLTLGLYRPAEPLPIPEGKMSVGRFVQRVNGLVMFVHQLEDMPPDEAPVLSPVLFALANLTIADMEIGGIEVASRLAMALWVGEGQYWVFFSEAMPDYSYVADASASAGRANVSLRELEFMEITVVGDDGVPFDPPELSVRVYRLA